MVGELVDNDDDSERSVIYIEASFLMTPSTNFFVRTPKMTLHEGELAGGQFC
jgi:hypothetical protein